MNAMQSNLQNTTQMIHNAGAAILNALQESQSYMDSTSGAGGGSPSPSSNIAAAVNSVLDPGPASFHQFAIDSLLEDTSQPGTTATTPTDTMANLLDTNKVSDAASESPAYISFNPPDLIPAARQVRAADDDALALYRSSWNPLTAGPQLIPTADLLAPGKLFIKTYVYSEFGYGQYGEGWSTRTQPLPQHLSVANPQLEVDYGITNSLQLDLYVPAVSWWQGPGEGHPARHGAGVGDTTVDLRYRFLIQRPGTWQPSLALISYLGLPTSSWFNTPSTPGGFAPLGKLPSSHSGTPVLTEALAFRKNVRPFRLSGGVYYSYALPSSNDGIPQRYGDIFQARLAGEYVLNDKRGFALAIELIGIHGSPFRIDLSSVTSGQKTFGVVGWQPTIEYNLTNRIISSVGVLFTEAGNHDIAGVFPNFSIYYYFGKVTPR